MDTTDLIEKVQGLTDLEHAVLVTLMAGEHCIIESEADVLGSVEEELKLVCYYQATISIFGLALNLWLDRFKYPWPSLRRAPMFSVHNIGGS